MNETQIYQAVELLKEAAAKLQEYCNKVNGDMNDSLAQGINDFLDEVEL